MATPIPLLLLTLLPLLPITLSTPTPTPWPQQFHSILIMNKTGEHQLIDLWYDYPNGRNFNIIRSQLDPNILYDLEWNNGSTFYYTLRGEGNCRRVQAEVGILRPDWLDGAEYVGETTVDGFLCDVWTKADFIVYYEDKETKRPVRWRFYTGREAHVMSFEVGAVLEDAKWQVPYYCFSKKDVGTEHSLLSLPDASGALMNSDFRGFAVF